MPLCFIAIQRSLTLISLMVGLFFFFLRNVLDHREVHVLLLGLLSHVDSVWEILASGHWLSSWVMGSTEVTSKIERGQSMLCSGGTLGKTVTFLNLRGDFWSREQVG